MFFKFTTHSGKTAFVNLLNYDAILPPHLGVNSEALLIPFNRPNDEAYKVRGEDVLRLVAILEGSQQLTPKEEEITP